MNKAVLILGGNIGDRAENLALSVNMIESEAGEIIVKSDIYETEPWGF
jgi:2-amino-4-hydroxy-6-hydroxymethyldihydropteridine diphosphokinase